MSTQAEWRRGSLTKRERLACRAAAREAVSEARVRAAAGRLKRAPLREMRARRSVALERMRELRRKLG